MSLLAELEQILSDKKAEDISIIDIGDGNPFYDMCMLCTAMNERSLEAIAEALEDFLFEEKGIRAKKDGKPESGWIVIEADSILINIFTQSQRDNFKLEELGSIGFKA